MKFIKFHLPKHFALTMNDFGSLDNVNSVLGERLHITETKNPAQTTQRRKSYFEKQTATRYIEHLATTRAINDISDDGKIVTENVEIDQSYNLYQRKLFFDIKSKQIKKQCPQSKRFLTCSWIDALFQNQLEELCNFLITENYIECDKNNEFYTEHKHEGVVFHADPNFNNENIPWYDWVKINWGSKRSSESVPAKLLIFVDFRTCFRTPFRYGSSTISEPGVYAIVYSLKNEPNEKAHKISLLIDFGKIMISSEDQKPELFIVHVDAIEDTLIAVPYQTNKDFVHANEWLFMKPRYEWNDILMNHLKDELKRLSMTKKK